MGSKARVSNDISPIINQLIQENGITTYIEPFVGGSNMIEHIQCENKYGYDNNEYLIEFWKHIQQGWNPLPVDNEDADMTKELYQDIKDHKEKYPKHIVALAGFCATYNAKWFGGYAGIVKTKNGTFRNYYHEAVINVLKQAEHIKDVHYECIDYKSIDVKDSFIYCDPPYQGKTGYKDEFDHESYWDWVRRMSKKNIVICSEYDAPDDFECIWQKELTTTLDKNSRSKSVEKLFVIKKEKENKEMELKINDYQLPKIDFNFDELKQEVEKTIADYANIVYSDDQMKEAKQDVAKLRKFVKAMSDERIRIKKDYMKPCDDFESKVKELTGIVDKAISSIDSQIKSCEDKQKQEKADEIHFMIDESIGENSPLDWLEHKQIWSDKWLNSSVTMKTVQSEIDARLEQIKNDIATLSNLPEFGFEAVELYKSTLDINKAIAEGHRLSEIQKRKAEHEAEMKARAEEQARLAAEAEANAMNSPVTEEEIAQSEQEYIEAASANGVHPTIEPAKQWVSFKALLSTEDALALKAFFESRNIEFKAV